MALINAYEIAKDWEKINGTSPSVTENQAEATIYDDRDTMKTKERFFSAILGFPVVTTAVL